MNKNLLGLILIFSLTVVANAQTCQTNIASSTPTDRFATNTLGTVIDNKTGLMWKKCSEGQTGSSCLGRPKTYAWNQAFEYVQTLNQTGFEGYTDWRLPSVNELRTIIEEQCVNPSTNAGVFPNTPPKAFWTSSPFAGFSNHAWYVNFDQGYDNYLRIKYDGNYLRLVRTQ